MTGEKVIHLRYCQIHDPARGGFFVGLKPTKQRHRGSVVYTDAFGRRIVITDLEGRASV